MPITELLTRKVKQKKNTSRIQILELNKRSHLSFSQKYVSGTLKNPRKQMCIHEFHWPDFSAPNKVEYVIRFFTPNLATFDDTSTTICPNENCLKKHAPHFCIPSNYNNVERYKKKKKRSTGNVKENQQPFGITGLRSSNLKRRP
ncbi:hypothetical protein CEXT_55251 [Caerostris extrusa]|uniref:Uncharacterized protein n=1 Tax=Caerostris extrusa TaxID=172846 RepID=A0AAV4Q852_CAEEX|nr:hypothetical protein CEXT_55251 [Caerostris extrusa]